MIISLKNDQFSSQEMYSQDKIQNQIRNCKYKKVEIETKIKYRITNTKNANPCAFIRSPCAFI